MNAQVGNDGYDAHNIWRHSAIVHDLYRRRARSEVEEMTCAAQAVELLRPHLQLGDSILDAGCGSGYFFHSLKSRGIDAQYYGFDATAELIDIGRTELPHFGLPADRLKVCRLEDFQGIADHVLCMNVLSNIDNYHRPLERLLKAARKSIILRESVKDGAEYRYVVDHYLNSTEPLKVHVNAYDRSEWTDFIRSYGYTVREVMDRRTGGTPEMVIDHPHYWTFFIATRIDGK